MSTVSFDYLLITRQGGDARRELESLSVEAKVRDALNMLVVQVMKLGAGFVHGVPAEGISTRDSLPGALQTRSNG